ncbi:MAG TPA: L,D-transpeptidase [Labilithrix sp.]
MQLPRFALALSVVVPLSLGLAACAADSSGDDGGDVTEDQLRKGAAEQWIYDGPLPALDSPSITVSQTAHTVRVTGYVPSTFDLGKLPFYADKLTDGLRTKIAVVYPIATGAEENAEPASYHITRASPWVPTNSEATWGGFPFIPYDHGIAFHGPITAVDGQWKLIRGPVSHGCNRMQGEHVVELANLIGVDMTTKVWTGTGVTGLNVPVSVLHAPDTWKGQSVDVDYPADPRVQRPHGNVKMFRTWSADDFAAFVCPLNKKAVGGLVVPSDYCARRYQNKYDPIHGP